MTPFRTSMPLAALMLCLLLPGSAHAQNVELRLEPEQPTYALGEPVVLHLTIRNAGTQPRTIPAVLEPQYGAVRYFIRGPDDERAEPFRAWALFENSGVRTLAPRETAFAAVRLFYGGRGWTFAREGTYEIHAVLGDAQSPIVRIRIAESSNPLARAQGRRLIASDEAGRFILLQGGDHLEAGRAVLREIADTETALAGYASYALGMNEATPYANLRTGAVRAANAAEAARLLQRSWQLLPETALFFRGFNLVRLEPLYLSAGRVNDAARLRQQFEQQLGRTALSPAVRTQIEAAAVRRR